jgi:hypothetical protein
MFQQITTRFNLLRDLSFCAEEGIKARRCLVSINNA